MWGNRLSGFPTGALHKKGAFCIYNPQKTPLLHANYHRPGPHGLRMLYLRLLLQIDGHDSLIGKVAARGGKVRNRLVLAVGG